MRWIILAIVTAALMVNGQEAKPHSNTHKGNSATEHSDSTDTAGQTVVVVNQQTPQREQDNHSSKTARYFRELLVPTNAPNLALVFVGIGGIIAAICSLRKIDQQISEMRRQVDLTFGQLRAMHETIAEMSVQSGLLQQSISVARDTAKAAQNGADAAKESADATRDSVKASHLAIEAGINEKRARIKIEVGDVNMVVFNPDLSYLQTNMVTTTLFNYGLTTAFIMDFRARFIRGDIGLEADFQDCKQLLYDDSLATNTSTTKMFGITLEPNAGHLSQDEVIALKKGDTFLHFYAYVEYQDVYGRYRIQTRHVYWKMRWGLHMEGEIMDEWEPVGPRGENEDREYEPNPN